MRDLPADWKRATLDEIGVEARPGFASGKHNSEGNGIIHLRPMNITREGRMDLSDVRFVQDTTDRRVHTGDVLFNNTNSPALVGKTALVTSETPLGYSNHMTRLRPPGELRPDFLAHQLHWLWMKGYFKTVLNNHVNQASVASKRLLETPIDVPPLAAQKRIVERLESHLSIIDSNVKRISEMKIRIADMTLLALDIAVRGARAPLFREDDGRSHDLGDSNKFDYANLEELPRGWVWRSAAKVCNAIVCGSTPHSNLMTANQGDIPFLKVYNIAPQGGIDFSIRPTFISYDTHNGKLARSKVFPGDVLTNIVGPPLGKTGIVPNRYPEWNINQAIVAFRAGPQVHPSWLATVLRSPFIIEKLKATSRATAGQFNISLSACRELPVPIPPYEQQIDLIEQLTRLTLVTESVSNSTEHLLARARDLRSAVFKSAFKGDL